MSFKERIHFMGVSFIHDTMYGLFMNADDLLIPAGLKEGQKVLEVGCGPGFFTIPAAEIVGENGIVYANDFNHFAIKKVEKKIAKKNITNVIVMHEDITKTTLSDKSIDLVFFFGVIHSLEDIIDDVLLEMDRVLTNDGILAVQKRKKTVANVVELIEKTNKFKLAKETKRIIKFKRK
ncbi:MAG: class I SAM-dependent methyltransferase [Candidatus Heimdallarchaeota archaeon]